MRVSKQLQIFNDNLIRAIFVNTQKNNWKP